MKHKLCFGNNQGIQKATCPKCGEIMDKAEKRNSTGEVDRGYMCNCGYQEWESDYKKVRA